MDSDAIAIIDKDPDADLDYTINWTDWLGGASIVTSLWILPADSGLTQHNATTNGPYTTVWLRGGILKSPAATYLVKNKITGAFGTDARSIGIRVKQR